MDDIGGIPTGSYVHGFHPLVLHYALDAMAGLKGVWAEMCGSRYIYPDKWSPNAPTLYTSGNFTLGINTALGKTGASRVIQAFFGNLEAPTDVMVGEEQPWSLAFSPPGSGSLWASGYFPLFDDFPWPGEGAGEPWPKAPDQWAPWGDPTLGGYPRPVPWGSDPLESAVPASMIAPLEEGGILGWTHPLGVPAATMPKKGS